MDLAEQLAIGECGRCHRPEREHQVSGDPETLEVWAWMTGCPGFVVSKAALAKVKRQARAPRMAPICQRCGAKGHVKPNCPW
jgi:hypothetical protein